MSASAVSTLQPVSTPWVKMSSAVLIGLPRVEGVDFTALKCSLLVIVRSSGRGQCELNPQQLAKTVGVSWRHCRDAVDTLTDREGRGAGLALMSATPCADGRSLYKFRAEGVEAPEVPEVAALACPKCSSTRVEADPAWRPIPMSILRAVLCCDHAMAVCLLAIAEASMRWDKAAKRPRATEVRLTVDYFERVTGLARRTIQAALAALQAEGLQFIGETTFTGRPSVYWARPENWDKGAKRAARTVTRVTAPRGKAGSEPAAKVESEGGESSEEDSARSSAAEFFLTPTGRCLDCGHRGALKPVLHDVEGGALPVPAPAGAAGGHNRGRPPTKRSYTPTKFGPEGTMRPELQPVYEYLCREWLAVCRGLTPDAMVVREIHEAMGGAPIAWLAEALVDRQRYVSTARYPYKVIAGIAKDAGKSWRYAEALRVAEQKRAQERERAVGVRWEALLQDLCLEDARFWFARDDIDAAFRARILAKFPELQS